MLNDNLNQRDKVKRRLRAPFALLFLFMQWSFAAWADVTAYFDSIKHDPNALYAFFKSMPKGGELHYHLTGGAYPEVMLTLSSEGDYCFLQDSWRVEKNKVPCLGVPGSVLSQNEDVYQQVLRAWSMKDFNFSGAETPHDHFFATFDKFHDVAEDNSPQLLVDILSRAASQEVQYLEIMTMPRDPNLKLPSTNLEVKDFATRRASLLACPQFQAAVGWISNKAHQDLEAARNILGCPKKPQQKVCQITVKFQYYALRAQPLNKVFEQALLGFLVAQKSPDFVGVNLVQAEDDLVALHDYNKQMQVFAFLHQQYPPVAIALHAGELDPQAVSPNALRFHIHDALYMGHALRIGHGVDIAHEDNAQNTLDYMHKHGIAVEINLISNAMILGVKGKQHPLNYYLAHQVPVVLSTDDEGIFRTDLTSQYVEAVVAHGLNYPAIKQINRNALTYSFLPGKSIWADPNTAVRVAACQSLLSQRCMKFIGNNPKAKVQRQLETQLKQFETNILYQN